MFDVTHHTFVHEDIKQLLQRFRYDAHPMGMLLAGVGALSTFYPDAKHIDDPEERYMAAIRMIAKVPTLAAFAYRHNMGLPYVYPDNDLSYAGNFLSMMFKKTEATYEPDPRLERALDVLFILHADHEQNCSTNAVRGVGSSQVDPYSAVAAGVAALYGPLHGGANEAVLRMLRRIESVENVPDFLEGVKKREERLMGFGHRVYKNYDPRARIIEQHMDEVFEATEYNPLVEIARELEKRALDDDFFTSRKLYPNVDYYSGIIYEALQIPTEMFTVIFAIPRTSGWISQWMEMNDDPEQKIARPAPDLRRRARARLRGDRGPRGPREDHRTRRPAGQSASVAAPEYSDGCSPPAPLPSGSGALPGGRSYSLEPGHSMGAGGARGIGSRSGTAPRSSTRASVISTAPSAALQRRVREVARGTPRRDQRAARLRAGAAGPRARRDLDRGAPARAGGGDRRDGRRLPRAVCGRASKAASSSRRRRRDGLRCGPRGAAVSGETEVPKGSVAAGRRVRLPRGAERADRRLRERDPQTEGADYELRGDEIVFSRPIVKEQVGGMRYLAMFLGLFGTYRKHETVDVEYRSAARRSLPRRPDPR